MKKTRKKTAGRGERGFSVIEMMIVLLIIGVMTGVTVIGVREARQNARRITATRELQDYLEKARADAVRRPDAASS